MVGRINICVWSCTAFFPSGIRYFTKKSESTWRQCWSGRSVITKKFLFISRIHNLIGSQTWDFLVSFSCAPFRSGRWKSCQWWSTAENPRRVLSFFKQWGLFFPFIFVFVSGGFVIFISKWKMLSSVFSGAIHSTTIYWAPRVCLALLGPLNQPRFFHLHFQNRIFTFFLIRFKIEVKIVVAVLNS